MNLNVEEKIKKSIKFIKKKFNKAVIEVKIVDNTEEESLYIYLEKDGYKICNKIKGKCDGILIIQNGENNFYEFKKILKKIPEHFDGNGTVFLRYDIDEFNDSEYVLSQFVTYFKLNKYKDVEEFRLLSKENFINGLFLTAQYHVELLDNEPEYEDYTGNYFVNKNRCGGCGCSAGNCSACKKQCCKK